MKAFRAELWKYPGPGGWHFVTLPEALSAEIRMGYHDRREGWGRLKANARIGKTEWKTSIWYDAKSGNYLLPIKASVRQSESLGDGDSAEVLVTLALS